MIYKKNNYNDLLNIKLDKTLVKKNIAVISAEYDAISFFLSFSLLQWRQRVNYTDLTDLYTCNYPKLEIL